MTVSPAGGSRIVLPVSGMTCAACQARVQRALTRVPGVSDATVNLMMNNATVSFDATAVSPASLVEAVRATGYDASLPSASGESLDDGAERGHASDLKDLQLKAVVSGVVGLLMMVFTMRIMASDAVAWSLLLATFFIMVWAGGGFYVAAWKALRHGSADMNTLVALGTGAAFLYSAVTTVAPNAVSNAGVVPDAYYEAVVMIIALILTGRVFEARAKRATTSALRSLAALQPTTALVIRDGQETQVQIGTVVTGDVVVVRPGERLPVDGEVVWEQPPWTSPCSPASRCQ